MLCGPGCWGQLSSHLVLLASGCRCLERGICRRERVEQLSLGRGKVRLSQFLPQGWGSCAVVRARGAVDLPGSMWESTRAFLVPPGLPGWVLASPRSCWSTCGLPASLSAPRGAGPRRSTGHCSSGVAELPLALSRILSLPRDASSTEVADPMWVARQQG